MRPKVHRRSDWELALSPGLTLGRLRTCPDLSSGGDNNGVTPRLNGVIAAFEQASPALVIFCAAEIVVAQGMNTEPYDGAALEMEHRPCDIRALRDYLQYRLDRRRILQRGALAPAVTPSVRIPPNGGVASQWVCKQVLD